MRLTSIKWIMLVSGLLTSTMFYAVVAPGPALMLTFGAALVGPLAVFAGCLIALSRRSEAVAVRGAQTL